MAQAPGTGIAALTRGFTQLSNSQKLGFLAALAAVAAIIAVALLWAGTPEYRVLYSNLSDRDGGEVIGALAQLDVPYRVGEGGSVVLVPAGQVYDLRLKLAAQGLPKGGAVGFELMDGQKFGISQFAEQINYQRALAGELARSVQSMAAVQSARVHLAIPRPTVFVREAQPPSASVFVATYPGRALDGGQVAAIQHLVASSVPELPARNVTVVDQSGNLLSSAAVEAAGNGLDASQLQYLHTVEATYARRIETILEPIVGRDNIRAQVTATLDFSQSEQTSESFKPNAAPAATIRSQQTVETVSAGPPAPGTQPAQPPGAASGRLTAPTQAAAARPAAPGTRRENVVNYEVDKTVRHTKGEVGAVKRLSAAVVVNYRKEGGNAGAYRPLGEEALRQINALTREAMGFDPERGDTLNVVNAPFSSEAAPGGEVGVPSPRTTWIQHVTSPAGMTLSKYAVVALVLLVALWLARSALRDLARAGRRAPGQALPGSGMESQLAAAPLEAASYEADLRAVRDMARQEPRIVANVVKEWVARE
jgi:flagellar M-ring protein FliF